MYFNNVHILFFVAIAALGLVVGKFIAWCNIRLPEYKKIFSTEFFITNKYKNIALITTVDYVSVGKLRTEGYLKALAD